MASVEQNESATRCGHGSGMKRARMPRGLCAGRVTVDAAPSEAARPSVRRGLGAEQASEMNGEGGARKDAPWAFATSVLASGAVVPVLERAHGAPSGKLQRLCPAIRYGCSKACGGRLQWAEPACEGGQRRARCAGEEASAAAGSDAGAEARAETIQGKAHVVGRV